MPPTVISINSIAARAAADVAFFERLAATQSEIARLDATQQPIAARTLRETALCELEAWLSPRTESIECTTVSSDIVRQF